MPSLRVLFLDDVWFEDDSTGFSKLLSARVSQSYTLARKNIISYKAAMDAPKSVSFHTPNLEYLDYADDDVIQLPSVNCENIVEATLKLGIEGEHD
ncbi:unnamed protein product [Cochlearia groenlandica]